MRVIELRAENFKGLKAVEITPDPHLVTISGRNGQGKTSVLDAIWAALAGGTAARQIPAPVRQGSDTAEVTVNLGDLTVTRTWKYAGATTALKVVAADGKRVTSPQAVLDKLVGALTFDPLAFSRLDERGQVAALLQVVDLPFNPDDLAQQRKNLFDRRTDINREARRIEGQLANTPTPREDLPDREVSVTALAEQHAAAVRAHNEHITMARNIDRAARDLDQLTATIARAEAELAAMRDQHRDLTNIVGRGRAEVTESDAALPDVDTITTRMRTAEATNDAIRARNEHATLSELFDEQTAAAAALTTEMGALDEQRGKALAAAVMPLPGMSFDDRGVTLAGVPLKACSSAEQLRASVALAMAANPTLRVIRVTDGSLLDDDGLLMIAELARDNDMQVWVEKVDSSGEVGIVIEAGTVAAVNA
jgi:DNA repair exonuclease SbcCD ATPase subunit